jgi:hypothetical protein
MKKVQESLQEPNKTNFDFVTTSLSLIIFMTSIVFLVESVF